MRPEKGHRRRTHEHGFAVILVLWLLVLLSAIAMHLSAMGRREVRIAFNTAAAAQAESLADAGVARAVFALSDADPARRWYPDGQPREIMFGGGRINITLRDENGKISLNLAPEPLIASLFHQLGVDPGRAAGLAAAIVARVRPNAAMTAPANVAADDAAMAKPLPAPFDSVDELIDLPGMTPEILAAARPHLSVYATTPQPSRAAADPVILQALADLQPGIVAASVGQTTNPPPDPTRTTVAIASIARTDRGAIFVRDAVIRVDSAQPKGYVALRWARGTQ